MKRSRRRISKQSILPLKEKPLNRKHISELTYLAVSVKGKSKEGLKRLQNALKKTGVRTGRYRQLVKVNQRRFYLQVIGGTFLAYVNLLMGKMDNLNTKADKILKIIEP